MKKELPKSIVFGLIGLAVLVFGLVIYKAMTAPMGAQPTEQDLQLAREGIQDELARKGMTPDGAPPSTEPTGEAAARMKPSGSGQ